MTAFIGREVFEVVYLDRKVALYSDQLLDKLILEPDFFLSANEYSLLIGSYTIYPSQIVCSTEEDYQLGTHKVLLKMTANCNPTYLSKVGGFDVKSLTP